MKYNELSLKPAKKGSRVGRGISAGRGKTAGRGTKGQGSRKSPLKAGFAGGQTPLYMQLPKLRGFKSHRLKPESVKTSQIDFLKKTLLDNGALAEAGLVASPHSFIKLIADGELKNKKTVRVQAASIAAIKIVEKAGGSVEIIARQGRPKRKTE